jgi:hypothetical protein
MKTLTLYRINNWDGAERQVPSQYHFEDKAQAEAEKGKYDSVSSVSLIIVEPGESLVQAKKYNEAAVAVAKLSPKERVLVGLPENLRDAVNVVTDKIAKSGLV